MAEYVKLDDVFDLSYCTEPATVINPYGGDYVVKVEDIRKLSTIDAVEVVRCKDCKYRSYDYDCVGNHLCEKRGNRYYCEDNDFCSYGERRENDTTTTQTTETVDCRVCDSICGNYYTGGCNCLRRAVGKNRG